MNSRFDYKPIKKRDSSKDDEFSKFTYEERMQVVSVDEKGNIEKYTKVNFWKEEKDSWKEFIKSFDIGSPSDQVKSHLKKGTPLITAHTLPAGDYTTLEKGAEIRRELQEKGITLEMLVEAVKETMAPVVAQAQAPSTQEKGTEENA